MEMVTLPDVMARLLTLSVAVMVHAPTVLNVTEALYTPLTAPAGPGSMAAESVLVMITKPE